jgi:hypothetical protein
MRIEVCVVRAGCSRVHLGRPVPFGKGARQRMMMNTEEKKPTKLCIKRGAQKDHLPMKSDYHRMLGRPVATSLIFRRALQVLSERLDGVPDDPQRAERELAQLLRHAVP